MAIDSKSLPTHVAFQSKYNSKYLSFVTNNTQGLQGFLRLSGDQLVSPYTKYQVQRSKNTAQRSLVHIRCCYSNKYWRRENPNLSWISRSADEPNENRSDWSCTLFEPVYVNARDLSQGIRSRHVQTGNYACMWQAAESYTSCVYVGFSDPKRFLYDVVKVINWHNLVILPSFDSMSPSKAIMVYTLKLSPQRREYLQFSSTDPTAPGVEHEVFITNNGTVLIKTPYYGKFWRRSPNGIWADSRFDFPIDHSSPTDTTKIHKDLLFEVIKVGHNNNKVALRNLGNDWFCKRLTTEGKINGLNAGVSTISREATLEVSEAILSREIYNVDYQLRDVRIYNQTPVIMSTQYVENHSSLLNSETLKFNVTETTTPTWNASLSLTLGVKVSFEAGIPMIGESTVEVSSELTGTYSWGEN